MVPRSFTVHLCCDFDWLSSFASFACWMQVGPEQAEAYLNSLGLSGMVRTMLILLPPTHLHMLPLHACMLTHTISTLLIRLCLFLQSSDQTLAASQQRSGYQKSCSCALAFLRKVKRIILLSFSYTAGPLPFSSSHWGHHHWQLSPAEPCKAQPGHRCGSHNSQGLLL